MSKQVLNIKQTTPETFFVQSGTDERVGYTVNIKEGICECPQNKYRGAYCKHQEIVDEHLIATEKIPRDHCNERFIEVDRDMNCTFQQLMLDRDYILYEDEKDVWHWKKREAYDAMDEMKKGEMILDESPDYQNTHKICAHFHLFDRESKLKGNKVVYLTVMGISDEKAEKLFQKFQKLYDEESSKDIEICDRYELGKTTTDVFSIVVRHPENMEYQS